MEHKKLTKFIGELFADWLETLSPEEFQAEVRDFDRKSGTITATSDILELKRLLREQAL